MHLGGKNNTLRFEKKEHFELHPGDVVYKDTWGAPEFFIRDDGHIIITKVEDGKVFGLSHYWGSNPEAEVFWFGNMHDWFILDKKH